MSKKFDGKSVPGEFTLTLPGDQTFEEGVAEYIHDPTLTSLPTSYTIRLSAIRGMGWSNWTEIDFTDGHGEAEVEVPLTLDGDYITIKAILALKHSRRKGWMVELDLNAENALIEADFHIPLNGLIQASLQKAA